MIGTIDIEIQAANPQMPLVPVRAYKNSPTSVRLRNVPKAIGDWKITSVQIVAVYPDNAVRLANCVLVGGVWVGTIEGCARSGRSENGFTVLASGKDERNNNVYNYVLGKGLIEILNEDGSVDPDTSSYYVHLYDTEPEEKYDGDMYPATSSSSGYVIWQNGEEHLLDAGAMTFAQEAYDLASSVAASASEINVVATSALTLASSAYDLASEIGGQLSLTNASVSSNATRLDTIEGLVPSQASASNQLADKLWVGDKVDSLETRIEGGSLVANNANNATNATNAQNLTNLSYVRHLDYSKPQEILGFALYYGANATTPTLLTKITQVSETLWSWGPWSGSDYSVYLDISDIEHPIFSWGLSATNPSTTFEIPNGATSFSHNFTFYNTSCVLTLLTEDTIALRNDNISQFRNDADYITSTQVEPWGSGSGWAVKAKMAMNLNTDQFLLGGGTYPYEDLFDMTRCEFGWVGTDGGALRVLSRKLYPWVLSALSGTSFDPPIEMNWGYRSIITKRSGRVQQIYSSACWSSSLINGTTTYLISADLSKFYTITGDPSSTGYYTSATNKAITISSDGNSIETYDGQSGQITCTRQDSTLGPFIYRMVAFEDQIPTVPSNVSDFTNDADYVTSSEVSTIVSPIASNVETIQGTIPSEATSSNQLADKLWTTTQLATKQDALTQTQLSVINEGVDDRKTVIKYVNDDIVSLDISGTIETSDIPDIGNVKEIKFGTTVTELGDQLIDYRAPYLSKVEIPDSVTNIGEYAFRTCGNLTDVKFGNGLQCIEEAAFNGCDLTTVELPESLKKIYAGAFSQNANLTTVYIPKYVDYLDFNIFYACPNAKIVFLDRTLEDVVNIGTYNGIKQYPWGVDKNRIYAIDSTDSYEFCTITPPEPDLGLGMYPITYSIQGVGYTVENGSELTITRTGAYYTVEHNNETLDSTVLLFTADKTGAIESYGPSIDENSLRFDQQIIPPHSITPLFVITTYQLKNKAVNTINVSPDLLARFDLIMPQEIGRARDFSVRVVADAGTYSEDPYLVAVNTSIINNGGELPEIVTASTTQCTTVVDFNEVASNKFVATSPNTLDGLEDLIDSI